MMTKKVKFSFGNYHRRMFMWLKVIIQRELLAGGTHGTHPWDWNIDAVCKMLIKERYRLLKQIGQGGFCKTFLAVDEGSSPVVRCAVQQLWLQNQTPEVFEQKAQRLSELDHPQIPTLIAHFQQDHHFYLVQEFIEGTNLATQVEKGGTFSETQVWQLLENLLPVLKFMGDHNIIHCDIKPKNIILRSPTPFAKQGLGEDLVLVDCGSATLVKTMISIPNRETIEPSIGSPEYAAPEQAIGKPVFASDLYSLGVTCIYLLTQIPPFDLFDIANNCWVWRQYLLTNVSEKLGKILDHLLQHHVSHRFQSADEVMLAMGMPFNIPNPKSKIQNKSPQCLHTLTGNAGVLGSVNSIAINSISPSLGGLGGILASGHDDKTIRLWDLNTKKVICTFTGHSQAVRSVTFSPDQKILATASDDKTIKLWNVNTLQEICTLFGHTSAVKSVAFSSDSQLLASGSWDKTVKIWDVKTGKEICTLSGHQLQVSAVAFSPIPLSLPRPLSPQSENPESARGETFTPRNSGDKGRIIASASFDRTIRLWEIPAAFESMGEIQTRRYTFSSILTDHTWAVLTVAFSPDGKILATGSDDNTIKLWEIDTGQLICTLLGHSWSVVAVAFSTDGERLISGSRDKTVKLWRISTRQEIATLSGHVDSVSAVAVSPVAQLIASGSRDKTIKLWELVQQQGELIN